MNLFIRNVVYNDGYLWLRVEPSEASIVIENFKAGEYVLKRKRQKRSNNANSYAWALITKIAAKIGRSPLDVYRHEVADVGAKNAVITLKTAAVDDFKKAFTADHLGRECEIIADADGVTDLLIRFGSSDYDTREMSMFLENLIQDCKFLDIETEDDLKIQAMLDDWEKTHG